MPYTSDQMVALLRECKRDPLMSYNIDYWDRKKKPKDPWTWKVVYVGPKNTPYEGGIFTVKIDLTNYPDTQPKFYFITRIFHLNIHWQKPEYDGYVCFGEENTTDIKKLLDYVHNMFIVQNPKSTWFNDEVKKEYSDYVSGKSKIFYEKAQNWVYLYAGLNRLIK